MPTIGRTLKRPARLTWGTEPMCCGRVGHRNTALSYQSHRPCCSRPLVQVCFGYPGCALRKSFQILQQADRGSSVWSRVHRLTPNWGVKGARGCVPVVDGSSAAAPWSLPITATSECPRWVIRVARALPVCPYQRTCSAQVGMSQRCHQPTHAPQQTSAWLQEFTRSPRQRGRAMSPGDRDQAS